MSCVVSKVHPGGRLGFSLSVLQPERTSSSSSSTLGTVTISSRHTLSSLDSQASSSHTHSPSLCLSWSLSPSLSLPLSSSLLLFFFLPTLLSHSNSLSSPPLPPSLLVSLDSGAQRTGFSLTPKQQEKQNKTKQKNKNQSQNHGFMADLVLSYLNYLVQTALENEICMVWPSLAGLFTWGLASKPRDSHWYLAFQFRTIFSPLGTTCKKAEQDSSISGSCYKIFSYGSVDFRPGIHLNQEVIITGEKRSHPPWCQI